MMRTRLSLLLLAIASGCATEDDAADDAADDDADTASAGDTTNAGDDANPESSDGSAEDSGVTAADSGDDGADESSSGGIDVDALYDCVDPMIITARPFAGPGYDPEMGLIEPQDTYVISSTQIYV